MASPRECLDPNLPQDRVRTTLPTKTLTRTDPMQLRHHLPVLAILAACSTPDSTTRLPLDPSAQLTPAAAAGQIYTMNNATAGNAIMAFDRAADGSLAAAGSYPTSGTGTGGGLGNQNALIITTNGRFLLVVNAGSNSVTSFAVRSNGTLERLGTWNSGGMTPVSVTESRGLVYVLNAGGTGNITGFTFAAGRLTMLAGSIRPLSSTMAGAAQVQFDNTGRVLIVTEKATNNISTYVVGQNGMATGPNVIASSGQTPFGFAVSRGLLVVSEAFGGAMDASAVSTYEIIASGQLRLLSASVKDTESAACWIAITADGRFAYTTNTASGTISGYALHNGRLTLLDADGVTATTGAGPIDLALTPGGQYIYSLDGAATGISGFAVGVNGALTPVAGGILGLPASTNGLAAR